MTKWNPPHYWRLANMIARCHNPRHRDYRRYGGRGINVCDDWRGKGGYTRFVEYLDTNLGPLPSPKHSLDRINNDGNYEPGNIKWSTQTEQLLNTRIDKRNTSGYRGVYWSKARNKWIANISDKNKTIYLGMYDTPEQAADAYNKTALKLAAQALSE